MVSFNPSKFSNNIINNLTSGASTPGAEENYNNQAINGQSNQTFLKGIVLECITDVSVFDSKKIKSYLNQFDSKQFNERFAKSKLSIEKELVELNQLNQEEYREYHLIAPRNSLILIPLNNVSKNENAEKGIYSDLIIAYPFFSSHLMLPCKPGEIIWFFSDTLSTGDVEHYWLSRVHGQENVEDVNYTHYYRKYISSYAITGSDRYLDFPNGMHGLITATTGSSSADDSIIPILSPLLNNENPFDKIFNDSVNKKSFSAEPVPRITPRIGDTIIQGSNNNAVILSTNRAYDSIKSPTKEISNALNRDENLALVDPLNGVVDIVVGRGRFNSKSIESLLTDNKYDPKTKAKEGENSTEPRFYKNSRGLLETEKNPAFKVTNQNLFNNKITANEGDPHLLEDAARILVSTKLNVDASLGLTANLPQTVAANDVENKKITINPAVDNSVILMRSDEIRIVARKDDERGINGSIRIVKEGTRDGDHSVDQAIITIQPDGTIIIDGPKIVIGSGKELENGKGSQISLGYEAKEPLVLGDTLATLLKDFMQATIEAFTKHTHPTGTGPSGPALPDINANTNSMQNVINKLDEFKSKIGKTK